MNGSFRFFHLILFEMETQKKKQVSQENEKHPLAFVIVKLLTEAIKSYMKKPLHCEILWWVQTHTNYHYHHFIFTTENFSLIFFVIAFYRMGKAKRWTYCTEFFVLKRNSIFA